MEFMHGVRVSVDYKDEVVYTDQINYLVVYTDYQRTKLTDEQRFLQLFRSMT